LKKAAENSDVVIHTADADHLNSAKALLAGLTQRASTHKTGRKPIYIHTSGTGALSDRANGEFSVEKIFNDDVLADTHENIPDDAWHREVDLAVYEVGNAGQVDTFIICPPLIYGTSTSPFNRDSQQLPGLIRSAIKHGRAVHVGKGVNIWSNVHVDDLVDFYILLLEKALAGEAPKNNEGYYFTENGQHNFLELSEHIGQSLVKHGVFKDPTSEGIVNNTDVIPLMLQYATGGNSRSRAVKARKLGWKPHGVSLFESIDETVGRILKTI